MKAASVQEIKQALKGQTQAQLTELCLRLARYKKENKELLTFLLFEADDMEAYIRSVQGEIDEGFESINSSNVYFIKKTLRKILRITGKYIKYTGEKVAEVELLTYFCKKVKEHRIPLHRSTALQNLYAGQLKKIRAAIGTMHEDLQYDYLRGLEGLED